MRDSQGRDRVSAALHDGVKNATTRFGLKEAFLPVLLGLAGSVAAPMAARAGVGALAKGVGGKAMAGMASRVMPHVSGGIGGAAFDAATSAVGGSVGARLGEPRQAPQRLM